MPRPKTLTPDARTAWGRRHAELVKQVTASHPDPAAITFEQRSLITRIASMILDCEKLEAQHCATDSPLPERHGVIADRIRRSWVELRGSVPEPEPDPRTLVDSETEDDRAYAKHVAQCKRKGEEPQSREQWELYQLVEATDDKRAARERDKAIDREPSAPAVHARTDKGTEPSTPHAPAIVSAHSSSAHADEETEPSDAHTEEASTSHTANPNQFAHIDALLAGSARR